MRNKHTTIFQQTVPRCIKTIVERGKIDTHNTQLYDISISWHFKNKWWGYATFIGPSLPSY
jgi:hypothetical protein